MSRGLLGNRLGWLACVLSLAASVVLTAAPIYRSSGPSSSKTVVEQNGEWAAVVIWFPTVLAVFVMLLTARSSAWSARFLVGVLLLLASMMGGLSIGIFCAPAAFALIASAFASATQGDAGPRNVPWNGP